MSETRHIFQSSAKLTEIKPKPPRRFLADCDALEIGQSFSVGINEVKLRTLRSMISLLGKKLEMKLRVVEHKEHDCYEIGRIG